MTCRICNCRTATPRTECPIPQSCCHVVAAVVLPPASEPEFVDCTCGHPNADHNLGECPFRGCGCGARDDENDVMTGLQAGVEPAPPHRTGRGRLHEEGQPLRSTVAYTGDRSTSVYPDATDVPSEVRSSPGETS